MKNLEERTLNAAKEAYQRQKYVSIIDVLVGMNLLAASNVDAWRKGRRDTLEAEIQGSADNLARVFNLFIKWALDRGLRPIETPYTRSTSKGVVPLQATIEADPSLELFFRTRYVAEDFPHKEKEKLTKPAERVVVQPLRETTCGQCGTDIDSFLVMEENRPLCMQCGGLGGLEFLPSGNTALTRRATKYSERKAVVVRFSRSRKRYERQGILAEPEAIERAERECVEDADGRAAARTKDDRVS
jgi:hypothetical protein